MDLCFLCGSMSASFCHCNEDKVRELVDLGKKIKKIYPGEKHSCFLESDLDYNITLTLLTLGKLLYPL